MDFVHDQLATGRKIRILTVVDTFSRFSPAVDARFSYRGEDVVQTLERICRQVGYPAVIRVDNGSEFISRDLDLWAYHKGVVLDFSRPGKPTDNSYIESFMYRRPAGARGFLQVQVIIRVRSCIRPLTATDTMVAGPDGVRGSRPHQRVALEWRLKLSGFARSSAPLDDHLLLLHLTPTGLGCGLMRP